MEGNHAAFKIAALRSNLDRVISQARQYNAQDEPTRSRELSLAITELERADHWLRDIVEKDPRTKE